jgi:Cys-rich four helix bundle protein (predicted Tat secretion target)
MYGIGRAKFRLPFLASFKQDPTMKKTTKFSRSTLLKTAGVAVVAAGASRLLAEDHSHHHTTASPLARSALDCVETGRLCLTHCNDALASGDKTMIECARTVRDMVAVCSMLNELASSRSRHLKQLLPGCRAVCQNCLDECKKHAARHAICKECANKCQACLDEMKKIA